MSASPSRPSGSPGRPSGRPRDVESAEHVTRSTFSPRAARWIVGLGAVSLIATLLLSVLANDDKPMSFDVRPNAFSRSAVGHKALTATLERLDIDVTVSRHRSAEKASRTRPLLLIEPDATLEAEARRLRDLVATAVQRRVPVVVVLPKWWASESATNDWARALNALPTVRAEEVLAELDHAIAAAASRSASGPLYDWNDVVWRSDEAPGELYLRGEESPWKVAPKPIQGLTTSDDGPLEPLVEVASGDAFPVLVARFREAPVFVVADPDLVNTMGIGEADHALVLYHLLATVLVADGVVIDEAVHGFARADSIWSELFRFPLVILTFHLALLLGLALWAAMRRFGRPEERPPRVARGKTTLLDNTATLLALGHHAGHGVREYFRATLRWLARLYGLPSELSDDDRVAAIADLARRRGATTDLLALQAETRTLVDRRADERRALQVARKIHKFRTEMIDGASAH